MINIRIICVGKLKERFYIDAAAEYTKRLGGYCKLDVVEIPEYRLFGDPSDSQVAQALEKECVAITEKLSPGTMSVALCIEGVQMCSRELSGMISDCAGRGMSRLVFIVGGSFGLHDDVKKGADVKLSLSKMTFPHNLARIMLLEQLYRAFKISEGGKYHK